MTDEAPSVLPPAGLGERGARFWAAAVSDYELGLDEIELLVEIARELDLVEALQQQLAVDGPMTVGSTGQPVAHPAIAQIHAGRQLLGRLLAQLSLPDEAETARVLTPRQATAKKAAETRWALERDRQARRGGGRGGGRRGA